MDNVSLDHLMNVLLIRTRLVASYLSVIPYNAFRSVYRRSIETFMENYKASSYYICSDYSVVEWMSSVSSNGLEYDIRTRHPFSSLVRLQSLDLPIYPSGTLSEQCSRLEPHSPAATWFLNLERDSSVGIRPQFAVTLTSRSIRPSRSANMYTKFRRMPAVAWDTSERGGIVTSPRSRPSSSSARLHRTTDRTGGPPVRPPSRPRTVDRSASSR